MLKLWGIILAVLALALPAKAAVLLSESDFVGGILLRIQHTLAGGFHSGGELVAMCLLCTAYGRAALAVADGVLGITAVGKAHGRFLANLAADVLDRILISNFSHSGF